MSAYESVVLLGAGLGLGFLRGHRGEPELTFRRMTFRRGYIQTARFAPDGQTVVYAAAGQGRYWAPRASQGIQTNRAGLVLTGKRCLLHLQSTITMDITSGFLGLLFLACAYSAQYWAKKCHDELKAIREELQKKG